MTQQSKLRARRSRTRAAGIAALAFGAAFAGFGSATAAADIDEVGPGPTVHSRQASEFSVIRINDFGVARGVSETRLADAGVVSATGEVRDSTKAIVGGTAAPFDGGWPSGPGIGDW